MIDIQKFISDLKEFDYDKLCKNSMCDNCELHKEIALTNGEYEEICVMLDRIASLLSK